MTLRSLFTAKRIPSLPFETDGFLTADGTKLEIGFIRHSSLIMLFDGRTIYIDPLTEHTNFNLLPKADAIIVTHEHYDHFDPEAIVAVLKEGTVVITNHPTAELLVKHHKISEATRGDNPAPEIRPLHNGERAIVDSYMEIEAVPAYNTSSGRNKYHPKGRDNGYIMRLGGSVIYVAGDTEHIPEMKSFGDIDIAFLPVNQPYTMTIEQAAEAAKVLRPVMLYPYHFGESDVRKLFMMLNGKCNTEVRIRHMP